MTRRTLLLVTLTPAVAASAIAGYLAGGRFHLRDAPQKITTRQYDLATAPVSPARPSPLPPRADWLNPGQAFVTGEIRVTLETAEVGTATEQSARPGKPCLKVGIRVANTSTTRKVDRHRLLCRLSDDIGNEYSPIGLDFGSGTPLYPGQQAVEVLTFEPPVAAAKELRLEIFADSVGGKGLIKFRLAPP
jgi:hypothetical protein